MSAATSIRRSVTTGLIALFLASGTVAVGSSAPAEAAVVKPCKASMSVTQPRQYTKTSVKVSQVGARANVTTTATAAVAAEIMPGRPPSSEMTMAIATEAYRPTLGSTPAMIEKPIASGIRASATTIPARISARGFESQSR